MRWLAADEAAVLLGRNVASVYRLANRHRWRRYVHAGRTYYHPADVDGTSNRLTRRGQMGDRKRQVGGV